MRAARTALLLVSATIVYNLAEAVIALWAGEEAESVALLGFGLDSVIECTAAGVLLWRLRVEAAGASAERVRDVERRAMRVVGVTFLLLAAWVLGQGAWALATRAAPSASQVGIALAVASCLIMPTVAVAKLRVARELGSGALAAEAKETLACALLSVALLVGLGANAALGWWWADPVAALVMVPWLVREGLEGVRGENCCAGS